VRRALADSLALGDGRTAWVLSNHDFPRLANRVGEAGVRAAALLLLTLPGSAFVFQGDEIGMADGPGRAGDPAHPEPDDRHGRDPHRHPMQWDATPSGGFTTGTPWLPLTDPGARNVADQERDPGSLLHLYRDLVAARRTLAGPLALLDEDPAAPGVLAYVRGEHVIALNLGTEPAPAPAAGALVRHTHDPALRKAPCTLGPGEGFVARQR
jgi:alpha-glucosidase